MPRRMSIATAPRLMPTTTSGRGPTRERSRVVAMMAVTMTTAVIGRKARPVVTGE